jgi:hypothetical protein
MTIEQPTSAPNTNDGAASDPAAVAATVAETVSQSAPAAQPAPVVADPAVAATVAEPAKAAEPVGAPEKYEFVAGEGQVFDEAIIGAYAAVAKDLDLPQDKAQKMLDTMGPAMAARQAEQIAAASAQWLEQSKADKEFGGDKLAENLAFVAKAREDLATPELRALLDQTGMGNHPDMIRMFYRYGKAISEDTFRPGRAASSQNNGGAQSFYSASKMNP